jgi:hypothetical protein
MHMPEGTAVAGAIVSILALFPGVGRAAAEEKFIGEDDVKVEVRLRNGKAVNGVARGGRLVEKLERMGFVPASETAEIGSGIRLWYVLQINGFIFVDYRDIEEVRVQGPVPSEEASSLTRSILDMRKEDEEFRAKRIAEVKAIESESRRVREDEERAKSDKAGGPGEEGGAGTEAPRDDDAATVPPEERMRRAEEGRALLKKFPPEDGWTPDRRKSILRREEVLGLEPTDAEKEFLRGYERWKAAFDAAAKPAGGAGAPETKKDENKESAPFSLKGDSK